MESTLTLHKDQHLKIEGIEYCVTGQIVFCNRSDGSRWSEYCIREIGTNREKWLSIDNLYEEYAIYTQHPYSSEFDEDQIFRSGYREADSGNAVVTSCFGNVDTEPDDTVQYTEYEDRTEELLIAVEQWEDETEYSRGYYLDADEIEVLDREIPGASGLSPQGVTGTAAGFSGMKKLVIAAAVLVALGVFAFTYMQSHKKNIHNFLETSPQFTYQTSVTSDLNSKEKADVYTSIQSVDNAVKLIIQAIDGKTEDVQKNGEDDSVAILTKDEYCLVYTSTEMVTTVQISSRAYVYQSTNTPYHASSRTHSYYRSYYFSRGFLYDRDRYPRAASGYDSYSGDTVKANPDDPYKSYSDSVRQSSINSRNSSGGGISSGK